MHLTNYALNKHNDNFVFNEDSEADDSGSKWSLSGLREYMAANGEDFASCWSRIEVRASPPPCGDARGGGRQRRGSRVRGKSLEMRS